MRIKSDKYWERKREYFSKNVDSLFDWLTFLVFFIFLTLITCYFFRNEIIYAKYVLIKIFILPIIIGGGIGFITVFLNLPILFLKKQWCQA